MGSLQEFIDAQLARGKSTFSQQDALGELGQTRVAFQSAVERLTKKGRLVTPRRGFYLILRPEDLSFGAPDPSRWIDPLMKHLGVDYRVSLLRAAAFHGSAHQAAMVFQVIAPRQLPSLDIGRQRVEFLYQARPAFAESNRSEWLGQLKTEAGFAKIAGVELTLLDMCRYFHQAAGINGVAQAVHDLGSKADPRILAKAALVFENSSVRRLGYLLEHFEHIRQANVLQAFAKTAKSFKDLDPGTKPIIAALGMSEEKNPKWKLVLNTTVEIDA